jgi:hypothetical protein
MRGQARLRFASTLGRGENVTSNLFYAWLLIATPAPIRPPIEDKDLPDIRHVAILLELMDADEYCYSTAMSLIDLLHERYEELQDAPRVWDAQRFPSHEAIVENLKLCCEYRRHVLRSLEINLVNRHEALAQLEETKTLEAVYRKLAEATNPRFSTIVHRRALLWLKDFLGEDFAVGAIPPAVPLWRFVRN